MIAPTLFRHWFKFEPSQHLTAEVFPCSWQLSLMELWGEARETGAFLLLRLGRELGWLQETSQPPVHSQSTLSALFWEQASICVVLMSGIQAYHSPPVCPTGPLTSQGGLSSHCWTPQLGCPIGGFNRSLSMEAFHLCNLPFPLSPLPVEQVPTCAMISSFPSYPVSCGFFLYPWLYRSLPVSS